MSNDAPALAVVAQEPLNADTVKAAEEIKRLLARGSDVVLADGATVTIVYAARSFAAIEVEYGSLNAYMEAIQRGTGGRIFHDIAYTLGLVLRQSVDQVWDLIDTRRISDYLEAMSAALLEAMPPQEAAAGNGGGPTTAPSPGAGSSTSPSSTGTSAPSSFGR